MPGLPKLIDTKGVMEQTGLTRASAEALMRKCERVTIPGSRKWVVREADVLKLIGEAA